MTAKKDATMLRIESYVASLPLAYEAGPIKEDMYLALHDPMQAADSEETIQAYLDDYIKERPHLLKAKVLIPDAMAEAAFGDSPTLKAQGDLVRRYGEAAAAECARMWKTTLSSVKPGRDPNGGIAVAEAKKALAKAENESPSRNPWHDSYRSKTHEERLAAQASVIKAFGTKKAASLAASAGKTLAGAPLRK